MDPDTNGLSSCPRCLTTKFQNPQLQLLVNSCGHSLCQSCIDILFLRGAAPCPECGQSLRRNDFRVQLFEDNSIEKELEIRQSLLKIYTKQESDFGSLREYNDYLEEFERLVDSLVRGVGVEASRERIEAYKRDNRTTMLRARGRIADQLELLDEQIRSEQRQRASFATEALRSEEQKRALRAKGHLALVDELMNSHENADDVVERQLRRARHASPPPAPLSAAAADGARVASAPPTRVVVDTAALERAFSRPLPSPASFARRGFALPPSVAALVPPEQQGAAGFDNRAAAYRFLADAFAGLFYFPSLQQPSN